MRKVASVAVCAALAGCLGPPSKGTAELRAERDALAARKAQLQQQVREAARAAPAPPGQLTPEVAVVVGVPNDLVIEILTRVFTDGLDGLPVRVEDLRVKLDRPLKVKVLARRLTLGDFELEVLLRSATARIAAGAPAISIGHGRIRLRAPLQLVGGRGRAKVHFRWAGRGLTKAVCADLDVSLEVEGILEPLAADLDGSALLAVQGSEFVLHPQLPRHRLRMRIVPSDESWAKVEALVAAQKGACRFALNTAKVVPKLRRLIAKGFPITVPTDRVKTVRISLAMTERLPLKDRTLVIGTSPAALEIGAASLWFGARFSAGRTDRSPAP